MISDEFQTIADLGWWTNGYLLTLSSFQLFYGKLYSLFSIKIVYLVAIALFEIGSLVCTTAPNSAALVVGRAIAGLGAAGIFVSKFFFLFLPLFLKPATALISILARTWSSPLD